MLRTRLNGVFVICRFEMGRAADAKMGFGAAQRFLVDHLAGHGLDDFGAGQEHEGLLVDHHDQVGQRGRIGGAPGAGSHDHADLGDDAGILRIAAEDFPIPAERINAFLDAGAAGIDQADDGRAGLDG